MASEKPEERCGFWPSLLSPEQVVAHSVEYDQLKVNHLGVFWREFNPVENRFALFRQTHTGELYYLTPEPFSLKNRVHEYGGGDWCLSGQHVFFVNESDQQIYRQDIHSDSLVSKISYSETCRFADLLHDASRNRIICIQEDHSDNTSIINSLVAVDIESGEITTLHKGHDFYSSPALSPKNQTLAWLAWDHPDMPWYSNQLLMADFDIQGDVSKPEQIGNKQIQQSFFQPEFSQTGELYFISDKNGWWNLYKRDHTGRLHSLHAVQGDMAAAQWQLGMKLWDFLTTDSLACTTMHEGKGLLSVLDNSGLTHIDSEFCLFRSIQCHDGKIYSVGWSGKTNPAIIQYEPETKTETVLRRERLFVDSNDISTARHIEFRVNENDKAYAHFYLPVNTDVKFLKEKPPLIIFTHGGPTSCAYPVLNLKIQFWTQRGFAVADVNYRGSSGYGREYRNALAGQWGESDVADCLATIDYLAEHDFVDRNQVFIRGSSAGGYTTLCSLTDSDAYKAGASLYGISDPKALIEQTHKFESSYVQWLIGDPDSEPEKFSNRTPLHNAENIRCPVIFFQGALDTVVVEKQTSQMVDRLKQLNIPVTYYLFEDEYHGFRNPQNNISVLVNELAFYQRWL